ncbi:MAG: MarR family transcriptional regulator [Pseudomonadota bacterium]
MADRATPSDPDGPANPLYLREAELVAGLDLLNRAYFEFASRGNRGVRQAGLGAAHLRAMQMIARRPGLSMGELLAALAVTKQSLHPVMTALTEAGVVRFETDPSDRRRKRLWLTHKGAEVEQRITAEQRDRLADAYRTAGPQAVAGFRQVLSALADG